jgi:hypothetical protein
LIPHSSALEKVLSSKSHLALNFFLSVQKKRHLQKQNLTVCLPA